MSKLFKKISAIVLTALMVLTMCSAVFADDGVSYPTPNDTATITVKNVEAGATVTAYQVVKAQYVDGIGFEKYETVDGVLIKDPIGPTSEEIKKIASEITEGTLKTLESRTLDYDADKKTYTANVKAGYWVVLVTGGKTSRVYNPMLAGVYYSVDGSTNTMSSGAVDASKNWTLKGTEAYEKSVEVSVDKEIVEPSSENTKGDDHAYGDYVQFKVTGTIPAYTSAYTKATYDIVDKLSDGLELQQNTEEYAMVLKVNNKVVELKGLNDADASSADATWGATSTGNGTTLKVSLASEYVLSSAGLPVELTYYVKIKDTAGTNFDGEKNTVKVVYTNDPTVDSQGKTSTNETPEKKTYHYTFEIDGKLFGSSTEIWNKTTTEITKTGTEETKQEGWSLNTDNGPLAGAEFTLTRTDKTKSDGTKYTYTEESGSDGELNFKGLDAGFYELQETKAPKGYNLNSTVYPVVITADYNEDGTLADYSININGEAGRTFTYTATYEDTVVHNIKSNTIIGVDTFEIKNTPISELPSTGGMGTYIFTVVGVVLMACAAGAFMVSRRKSEN